MGLGLTVSSGGGGEDRMPYVKYDARAGRMFRIDRNKVGDTWQTDTIDISMIAQFVADLANIQVGWISYTDQGPVKVLASLGSPMPARPEGVNKDGKPAFKQGFSMNIALSKECGGGIREFGSNAGCVIEAMNELHDLYLGAAESKAGKLPVVKITSTIPVKAGQSTNYKPVLSVMGWVDRPATLQAPTAQTTTAAPPVASPPTAPSTGSTIVPPPAAQVPQQAAAMAGASDFG